jgi:hypothetical protein
MSFEILSSDGVVDDFLLTEKSLKKTRKKDSRHHGSATDVNTLAVQVF